MTQHIRKLTLAAALACGFLIPSMASAQGVGPREDNTSLNGTRLTYYQRPSVDQCQSDCANNANCKGFTWIRAGTYNPSDAAMCYLLSAVTGRVSARGHISAVKGGGDTGGGGNQGTVIKIAWSDYPLVSRRGSDKNGQRYIYSCPANGTPSRVWGTDIYSDDSSICTAAVHAKLISFSSGGTVTVEVQRPGPKFLEGSLRNGVRSDEFNNGPNPTQGGFVFIR